MLLCGLIFRNKDSCNYLTTNCWKEKGKGGVGPMIGTSASKRGWSGRGHMRARVEGLVVGEGSCKRTVLPIKIDQFFENPATFQT